MQHSECVERAVMRALQKRFRSRLQFGSELDYVKFDINPAEYSDADSFKKDYVLVSFLRKWKGLDTKIDLEGVTFDGWKAAEHQCFKTNKRLELEASTGFYSVAPSLIVEAQRKISQVLGRFSFERIEPLCRFGKGATSDIRRGADLADKMLSELTVTEDCLPYAYKVLGSDFVWQHTEKGLSTFEVVRGNRMITVPKSAKTHRMISAEPTMNGFVQQSVGRFIRERLKRFGVDLNDQTINQDLAFSALVEEYSTIDLSSASDTLCINLVKLLLPDDWFTALNAMRSKFSTFDKKTYCLSKFSSMGNAFTFELESLIFWALSSACKKNEADMVAVYGDDIVVSNANYAQTKEILEWAGFSLNVTKSYTSPSRFYESCGRHYFDLEDVTPPFQKDVCLRPIDYIRLHNRLWRASVRLKLIPEFKDARKLVIDAYRRKWPKLKVAFGPSIESDQYFIDPLFDWGRHNDYVKLLSLVRVTRTKESCDSRERMFYAYKLRTGTFSNLDPRGYSAKEVSERFVWKHTKIWRSAFCG